MGIGLEEKKRIFGAFERLDNARNIPGFGLGLAITARLVSSMQGHVEEESVPGKGSRFSVFLPILPAEQLVGPEEKFFPVFHKKSLRTVMIRKLYDKNLKNMCEGFIFIL